MKIYRWSCVVFTLALLLSMGACSDSILHSSNRSTPTNSFVAPPPPLQPYAPSDDDEDLRSDRMRPRDRRHGFTHRSPRHDDRGSRPAQNARKRSSAEEATFVVQPDETKKDEILEFLFRDSAFDNFRNNNTLPAGQRQGLPKKLQAELDVRRYYDDQNYLQKAREEKATKVVVSLHLFLREGDEMLVDRLFASPEDRPLELSSRDGEDVLAGILEDQDRQNLSIDLRLRRAGSKLEDAKSAAGKPFHGDVLMVYGGGEQYLPIGKFQGLTLDQIEAQESERR